MPGSGSAVNVRIGIHTGPITSGIVGYRMPKFCLFGDAMNTTSRMESTCPHGCIHISGVTYQLLATAGQAGGLVSRGGTDIKGKGRMVSCGCQHRAAVCEWLCQCCIGMPFMAYVKGTNETCMLTACVFIDTNMLDDSPPNTLQETFVLRG
jgi:hypothetical protein